MREQPQEMDTVTDGENIGTVYKCFSRRVRQEFLSVKVRQGPKAGEWDKVYRYRPLLDWSETGIRARCVDCEREFRRPEVEPDGRVLRCRTHEPVASKIQREMERDREPSHFGVARAKWQRRRA
jgi:hypothetical protein